MFKEEVTTQNGIKKTIVANSKEDLDEAVKVAKAEQSAVAPDIHNPEDGNKIVSPDNKHTEDVPTAVDNSVEEAPEPPKAEKPKKAEPGPEEFEEVPKDEKESPVPEDPKANIVDKKTTKK